MTNETIKQMRSEMFTASNKVCEFKNACGRAMDEANPNINRDADPSEAVRHAQWVQADKLRKLAAQAEAALDALRAALYDAQK